MKLIIEHHVNGCFYVYREDEKHFANVQWQRDGLKRKTLKECDEECELGPGEYVVVDLKKGQR